MFDYNPFPNSYLGRLIWSEIERQAGEGCLSDSMADAFYMLKLKNACESFIKQPNVEAKRLLKIVEHYYYVDFNEATYLNILCDRVIHRSDDYRAWYLVCKLANATAHHYEQDTNASRGVLADALRECSDYALTFIDELCSPPSDTHSRAAQVSNHNGRNAE